MKPSRIVLFVLGAVVLSTALASGARAMPGFARKYKFSCTTCHAPFPRLNDFGEEFAARGFRLENAEQEPARAYVETGDPLLLLTRDVPLGMRLEGFASYKEDAAAETDLELPWTWKIISGGPLSETAAYYFYFLVERGEVEGLEDAYLQLNEPLGLPVDVLAGQFQVSDPLFKRETRLEREDYEIYRTRVGDAGVNLTYDRGVMLGADAPGGVEVVLQVVNGNGIPHADDERNFDGDAHKNVALRLARSFAGSKQVGAIRVGAFGYYGVQEDEAGIENRTWYLGPDLSLVLGDRVQVNAQYLERRDDDPMFERRDGDDVETRGGFLEVHWFPYGWDGRWVFSGLYNKVDSDDAAALYESVSITGNHLIARNLRLLLEGAYDMEAEAARGTVGLVAAF